MSDFNYKVVGSVRVANNMRAAAAASKNTGRIAYKWGQQTRRKLKGTKYPPIIPGQRYKRTGQLANRWACKRNGKNAVDITNEARQRGHYYARYVIGDRKGKGQAWMHEGRWWVAREIIDGEIPALREAILDDITEAADA